MSKSEFTRLILIFSFLSGVVLFQNCGSAGSGGGSLNVNTTASTGGSAIVLTPVTFTSNPVTPAGSVTASASVSGSSLYNVICSFTLVDSNMNPLGAPTVTGATQSGTVCSSTFVAPTTTGVYGISIIATNSGGGSSNEVGQFDVGTVADPSPVASPTPLPTWVPIAHY